MRVERLIVNKLIIYTCYKLKKKTGSRYIATVKRKMYYSIYKKSYKIGILVNPTDLCETVASN